MWWAMNEHSNNDTKSHIFPLKSIYKSAVKFQMIETFDIRTRSIDDEYKWC